MGSMYRGLPGIMKLDPACQELWDGGGVKGGGTLNPRPRDGGMSTRAGHRLLPLCPQLHFLPCLGLSLSQANRTVGVGKGWTPRGGGD